MTSDWLGDRAPPGTIDLFLQPGEYFVGNHEFRVRTLLGSCVSFTLWHRHLRIGAMSHCLLAEGRPGRAHRDPRYCDDAFALMTADLARQGVNVRECEAKLFGGGRMFAPTARPGAAPIGISNGHYARRLLRLAGVRVRAEHLFGQGRRQVVFDIRDGAVWVRHVRSGPAPDTLP
jgi:chemotaxis protein CheD